MNNNNKTLNYGKIVFHDSAGDGLIRLATGELLEFHQNTPKKIKAGALVEFKLYENVHSKNPFSIVEVNAEDLIYEHYYELGFTGDPNRKCWDRLENNGDDLEEHIIDALYNGREIEWEEIGEVTGGY